MPKNLRPFASMDCSKPISAGSAPLRAIKTSSYPADWQWNTDRRGFARIDTDLCCLETETISVAQINVRSGGVCQKKAVFDRIHRISRIFDVENRIFETICVRFLTKNLRPFASMDCSKPISAGSAPRREHKLTAHSVCLGDCVVASLLAMTV